MVLPLIGRAVVGSKAGSSAGREPGSSLKGVGVRLEIDGMAKTMVDFEKDARRAKEEEKRIALTNFMKINHCFGHTVDF